MKQGSERQQKIDRIRRRESLDGLVGHAERVELVKGRAVVVDKLPAPIDEFGIPRVNTMVSELLGQMATQAYVWTGKYDLHHMATPKADYNVIPDNLGQAFRSLPALKVDLPRQMHNLSHELFLTPKTPPSEAVMRQALLENEQLKTLYMLTADNEDPDAAHLQVYDALSDMVDPRVNIMPSRESLAEMDFLDLRRTVASLIRVRRFAHRPLIHPAVRPRAALRHRVM